MSSAGPTRRPTDFAAITRRFALDGRLEGAVPYGSGHINDTYAATLDVAGRRVRYILQRINDRVFQNVPALMENIGRVTAHVTRRVQAGGGPDVARRALTLVPTRDGRTCHRDDDGGWWRCYHFIEGARTHDIITTPQQAREAARAFGEFQGCLLDLPGERLHETIPFFHHTRRRFDTLCRTIEADPHHRTEQARAEIAFALDREPIADVLLNLQARGAIAERITHNDTKLNNVMLDDVTQAGLCVIDLDTVMPGLGLHDFGDMVRTATNAAAEDERDLGRVRARLDIFAALVEGYLAAARPFLAPAEVEHLALAGQVLTFENGIRFLTDFLQGDVYYKIKHSGHNLDRARAQFALLRSLEDAREAMEKVVGEFAGR